MAAIPAGTAAPPRTPADVAAVAAEMVACGSLEMGADSHDIGLTIHPHPTLSETVALSAEVFEGTITDLYIPKKG